MRSFAVLLVAVLASCGTPQGSATCACADYLDKKAEEAACDGPNPLPDCPGC